MGDFFMLLMCIKAFLVGGTICVIGQLLIDITKITPAKILVIFVCCGVVLGGVGVYDKLIDFAGAGATIPLTGFGASLSQGVRDGIKDYGFMGIITGPLSACAGGVTVAVLCALIVAFVTKPKDK